MQAEWRTPAELERDEDRDPVAAVEFMGLQDDMTVVEFLPAVQAYYTKILGPVAAMSLSTIPAGTCRRKMATLDAGKTR